MQDLHCARCRLYDTWSRRVRGSLVSGTKYSASVPCYPHSDNLSTANAAARLKHEEAATSVAGAMDADSNGYGRFSAGPYGDSAITLRIHETCVNTDFI